MKKWVDYYRIHSCRSGILIRFEKGVDPEVKRAIQEMTKWLRQEYVFPKRVKVYVFARYSIKASNGEQVCGTFFRPADRDIEPYIRISTGDYPKLLTERGKDNALAAILFTLLQQFTYYFQWLNNLDLTLIGETRQATNHARKILSLYAETRDHP